MNTTRCLLFLLFGLSVTITAQVKVTIQAINPGGVTLVDGTSKNLSQNFVPNKTILDKTKVHVQTRGTPSPYFIDYVEAEVQPPKNWSTFYQSRVSITGKGIATKGTTTRSLFTTDNANGKPGTQKFRITMTAASANNVFLDFWSSGNNFGNATATIKMTLGTKVRTWTWAQPRGYTQYHEKIPYLINGTVNMDVEITGVVTPGVGGGKYYDGYECRYSLTVIPSQPGSFVSFGKGCGPATLSSLAPPVTGTQFTLAINNAPATATAAVFVIGTSNSWIPFINVKLPFALDHLGAPGCSLYVSSFQPILGIYATKGVFTKKIYLNPWASYTYYVQGIVLDPRANSAGFSMTQAATLKF